jgi:WD40 repeat protein
MVVRFSNSLAKTVFLTIVMGTIIVMVVQGQNITPRVLLDWSRNGNMLAVSSENSVRIIDAATSNELSSFDNLSFQLTAAKWSYEGNLLAIVVDGSIEVWENPWDENNRSMIGTRSISGYASSIAWYPNEDILAIANGSSIEIWEVISNQNILNLEHPGNINDVAWSVNGTYLASANSNGEVRVWNGLLGNYLFLIVLETDLPVPDDVSPALSLSWLSESHLAIGSEYGDSGNIEIWTIENAEPISRPTLTLRGHSGNVQSVQWRPYTTQLASGSTDGTIRVWDTSTQEQIAILQAGRPVYSVVWNPDGTYLAYGDSGGTIQIVSVPGETPSLTPPPTPASLQRLRLTSVCSADLTVIRRWRVRNSNPYEVTFTWDVYHTTQTGTLTIPAANGGTPAEVFFETQTVPNTSNTVRIFVDDAQQDVKASSGAVCTP